jgi:hypothetical protein
MGKNYCQCGCGEEIPFYLKHKPNRRQFYKRDHHRKFNGENNPAYKHGRYTDCHSGYIHVLRPNHPFCNTHGYVLEHRLIMEKHIDRYLTRDEHVHHKNENRQDNRIENLQIVSPLEHLQIHGTSGKRIPKDRKCAQCGVTVSRYKSHRLRSGFINSWKCIDREKNIYLCNRCRGKDYYKKSKK